MEITVRSPVPLGTSATSVLLNSCGTDLYCDRLQQKTFSHWSLAMLRREHETRLSHLMASSRLPAFCDRLKGVFTIWFLCQWLGSSSRVQIWGSDPGQKSEWNAGMFVCLASHGSCFDQLAVVAVVFFGFFWGGYIWSGICWRKDRVYSCIVICCRRSLVDKSFRQYKSSLKMAWRCSIRSHAETVESMSVLNEWWMQHCWHAQHPFVFVL